MFTNMNRVYVSENRNWPAMHARSFRLAILLLTGAVGSAGMQAQEV